jgi:hypothetical protein
MPLPVEVEVNLEVTVEAPDVHLHVVVPPVDVHVDVNVDVDLVGVERWLQETNQGIRDLPGRISSTLIGSGNFNFDNNGVSLATIFPFSVPFSFGRMIESLSETPKAPRFEIDFAGTILDGNRLGGRGVKKDDEILVMSGMQGTKFVLDLEDFENIAIYIRWGYGFWYSPD